MTSKEKENRQRYILLCKIVDKILYEDWDPIGVKDIADARDEYVNYVPKIVLLIWNGASEEEIANNLGEIITNQMGMVNNIEHCLFIASKLISECRSIKTT